MRQLAPLEMAVLVLRTERHDLQANTLRPDGNGDPA
jgi:hypothetical protein